LKRKRLIDTVDLVLICTIILIPVALWRIASKWEDNNEAEYDELHEIDKEIKDLKKEIADEESGHYSDDDNLKRWA